MYYFEAQGEGLRLGNIFGMFRDETHQKVGQRIPKKFFQVLYISVQIPKTIFVTHILLKITLWKGLNLT